MPKVLLISGKARHGKDTFAKVFKDCAITYGKKALIIRYGDILKCVCTNCFGWDGKKDKRGRTLLQQVGTEVIRKNNPDAWVNCVIEIVKGFGDNYDYVLIPDTRFPNEIEKWKDTGLDCTSIRVVRENEDETEYDNGLTEEQKNHLSEISLDDYNFDYVVINRDLSEFVDSVEFLFEKMEG